MATFVNDFFSRMLPRTAAGGGSAFAERHDQRPEPGTLRAMPNEQIHLFIKRIDNNHVVRTEDRAATATCWKTIGMACIAAVVAVGMIVPTAYGKLAGYQIERSRDEQARLEKELAQLEAVEDQLLSPGVLAREAERRNFTEPSPETLVVLNVDRSTALAMNQAPAAKK
jgi:hypothetical protein